MRIECIRGHFAALIETKWNEQNVRFVIIERRQKRNEKRSVKRRFLRPRSHLWSPLARRNFRIFQFQHPRMRTGIPIERPEA